MPQSHIRLIQPENNDDSFYRDKGYDKQSPLGNGMFGGTRYLCKTTKEQENWLVWIEEIPHTTTASQLNALKEDVELHIRRDHLSLPKIYAFHEYQNCSYLVMQYLPGWSLFEVATRAVPVHVAVEWVCQVLDAFVFLQQLNISYSLTQDDLNLVWLHAQTGRVYLLDIGLQRRTRNASRQTLATVTRVLGHALYKLLTTKPLLGKRNWEQQLPPYIPQQMTEIIRKSQMGNAEGYTNLQDMLHDLRRIYEAPRVAEQERLQAERSELQQEQKRLYAEIKGLREERAQLVRQAKENEEERARLDERIGVLTSEQDELKQQVNMLNRGMEELTSQLQAVNNRYEDLQDKYTQRKASLTQVKDDLKAANEALEKERAQHQHDLEETEKKHREALVEQNTKHEQALAQAQKDYSVALEAERAQHKADLEVADKNSKALETALAEQATQHQSALEAERDKHKADLDLVTLPAIWRSTIFWRITNLFLAVCLLVTIIFQDMRIWLIYLFITVLVLLVPGIVYLIEEAFPKHKRQP